MKRQLNSFAAITAMIALSSSLALSSLGCSNKMSFEQDSTKGVNGALNDDNGTGDADVELPGQNDPATQAVAATCAAAAAAGTLRQMSTPVAFPDPGRVCSWEADGNLERRDQYHQGRIQQKVSITLPVGSTLCHVKFEFQQQAFRFDDHFWLTFNDAILASSINYSDRFGVTNGLSFFDWTKIVGSRWDVSREGVHCLAGAACSWPETDTEGTIRMNFRDGTYYAVTARDRTRNQHEFSMVTVGDNDATDCQHRPVDMNATLQYVQ